MYSFTAYGLGIHSEIPFPEFIASKTEGDVIIRLEEMDPKALETIKSQPHFKIGYKESVLSLEDVGIFHIRDGREVVVTPVPDVDIRLIRRYLVGNIMALLLYQRGLLILHASAVNINGCATAFMGYPGSGKSSLAAALFTRGHNIITDDVTALDMDNETVRVFPGFPQLKLSLEVAELFGYDIKNLIVLNELEEKRGYRFVNRFTNAPIQLSRVYVLTEEADQGIESLSPQEAVIEFIRHSVPTRFAQPGNAAHLLQCVELAKKAATFRIKRSSSIQVLPDLAKLVEGHIVESS